MVLRRMHKKRLCLVWAAFAVVGLSSAGEVVGAPLASFGSDPESAARAMAATASVNATAAAAVNPARLIDAKGVDLSLGIIVADDAIKIQRKDAGLPTYVAYQLGMAAALPIGDWRDRVFFGVDVHLPGDSLYSVDNTTQDDVVVLHLGNDARRFTLDASLGFRLWERIAVGIGVHVIPDVVADVVIDFTDEAQNSESHIEVGYKFAPIAGFYAQFGDYIHLGVAYRAATRLALDVPARVSVSESIGQISTRLEGYAYSEPHDISLGLSVDFSPFVETPLARFAFHAAAQIQYYPYPLIHSARVTLYDENGETISESTHADTQPNLAYALRAALDWRPLDEISVSLGYAFEKTHVPAPRSIFNIIDGDRNQIAFGATFWCPESWFKSFNLGFSTSAKFDFYDIRDVEKHEFLFGNPGSPALRFEGYAFAWHAALRMQFQ